MSTEKAPTQPADAPHYNPVAEVFGALVAFDRPVDIHQLRKALPKMPEGTVSSTLTKLREVHVIERNAGTRPALWRAIARSLPPSLQGPGRLSHPVAPGTKRPGRTAAAKAKGGDVLLTLPVGRRDTMTVTEKDARALYASLGRLFGEKR